MAPKHPTGREPPDEKRPLEEAEALTAVAAKLSVLGDLFKLIGEDSFALSADTPLGLYLIMGECVEALKRLRG